MLALSHRPLLGLRIVCGDMSEVQLSFSSHSWCSVIVHSRCLTQIFEFLRGFPEGVMCKRCSPECASCQGDPSKCLSCEEEYLLQDHTCRLQCLEGFYPADRECRRCPAHCRTCTQDGLCTGEKKEEKNTWRRLTKTC